MKLKIILGIILLLSVLVYSCQSDEQIEFMRYYTSGQELYKSRCQNCHGAQGEGLAALIPPLTDSAYLKKNRKQLACYLQNGLTLPILVNGKAFNGQMPPANLAPMEIAQVLTYIQNANSNNLGLHNVSQVNDELKQCK